MWVQGSGFALSEISVEYAVRVLGLRGLKSAGNVMDDSRSQSNASTQIVTVVELNC